MAHFIVAEKDRRVVGAVQLRTHRDGAYDLGNLVVEAASRGQGIATQLIDRRLAGMAGRILMITGQAYAEHYGRWGFKRIEPGAAPPSIQLHYWLRHLCGGVISFIQRRARNRLAVLDRAQEEDPTYR